ncbi:MAG: peptidylprolyl isomerase [Vallitalea sp.]|nr:peptidylprolyl isomerase [Vallitalea sp.]
MKSTYKMISKIMLLFICIFYLVGCSSQVISNEKKDNTPSNEQLLTINGVYITIDEVMPYLLQVKMEFEQLGGEDVWDHNDFSGGKKAEDVAKQGVIDNVIRTKILITKSKEMGISLTESEQDEVSIQALKYYEELDKADIIKYRVTKDSILKSFNEYQLANKVMHEMTKEYIPAEEELQEELIKNNDYANLKDKDPKQTLKKINVQQILFKTHNKNENDEYTLISQHILEEAKTLADKVYKKAIEGEDFTKLVRKYSQDADTKEKNGEDILLVGLIQDEFPSLINLQSGEISDILQSKIGYHIYKIIEIIEPTKEDIKAYNEKFSQWEYKLRMDYSAKLKTQAFNDIYMDWRENTLVELNEELWKNIDIFGNINKNTISNKINE